MSNPAIVLLAVVVVLACAQLGGGVYERLVLDPVWPGRPAVIQPQNGGVSRRRFWIPTHALFEVSLIAAVVWAWGHPEVRNVLLIAVVSHVVMRIWTFVDFIPKAVAFEKSDPATVERALAERWTRRSVLRLPLDVLTCAAVLTALVAAA